MEDTGEGSFGAFVLIVGEFLLGSAFGITGLLSSKSISEAEQENWISDAGFLSGLEWK